MLLEEISLRVSFSGKRYWPSKLPLCVCVCVCTNKCKADTVEGKINNIGDCKQHLSKGISLSTESWML